MLDHLKQERQAASVARERVRLAIFVGVLVLFGGALLVVTRSRGTPAGNDTTTEFATDASGEAPVPTGPVSGDELEGSSVPTGRAARPYRADQLAAAVARDEQLPHRWAWHGLEYLESIRRHGVLPFRSHENIIASALTDAGSVGRVVEVEGRVIDRAQEQYKPPDSELESAVLWSLVVEDPRGGTLVVVSRSDGQNLGGGPKALAPSQVARPIEVGDTILVRGVVVQHRLGTLNETVLRERTPVVYSTEIRRDVPAELRAVPIDWPDHVDWDEIRDLTLAETMRTDNDAIFQLIQWARARGIEQLRKDVEGDKLPWTEWGRTTFEESWKHEVDPEDDSKPRTFTTGARGKVFRLDGIIADAQVIGWDQVPPNTSRVHDFSMLTMLADDYRSVAVRFFSPFDLTDFKGVKGLRKDHVRVHAIFVKNHTYRTRHKDPETQDYRFLTVPLFILIAAEPHPGATDVMRSAMYWIAGAMALLALLFYFVLVRGGRKQQARMEAMRSKLRKSRGAGPSTDTPSDTAVESAGGETPSG